MPELPQAGSSNGDKSKDAWAPPREVETSNGHNILQTVLDCVRRKIERNFTESAQSKMERLIVDPENGYGAWRTFLETHGFPSEDLKGVDKNMPTIFEASLALFTQITPKQRGVLEDPKIFKDPQFFMVPVVSIGRLLLKNEQENPYGQDMTLGSTNFSVSYCSDESMQAADQKKGTSGVNSGRIIGWEVGIVEASKSPNILPGENVRTRVGERVEWFDETLGTKGIQRPDFNTYALLAAQAKEAGKPIDNIQKKGGTWTLSRESNSGVTRVTRALWDQSARRVHFREGQERDAYYHEAAARQRAMIKVRVN